MSLLWACVETATTVNPPPKHLASAVKFLFERLSGNNNDTSSSKNSKENKSSSSKAAASAPATSAVVPTMDVFDKCIQVACAVDDLDAAIDYIQLFRCIDISLLQYVWIV